jgi:ribonuclease-3
VNEQMPPGTPRTALHDNEQFEFLGDAILGFIVSERLLAEFPEAAEGKLSETKALLVSASHLLDTAKRIGLGGFLFLGRGEEMSGGREKKAMLADALEAIIAAVYLDGGVDAARRFINAEVLPETFEGFGADHERIDYKTALQELARSHKLPLPHYELVRQSGPEHAKLFTISVAVGKQWTAQGEGSTKKGASQVAAQSVYRKMSSAN